MTSEMVLMSWNVNGIRSALRKGFAEFFESAQPDILCLQETKAEPEQVDYPFTEYHQFWNWAEKKGYSGTAILSKVPPLNVTYGLGIDEHDREGRIITAEYERYYLISCYTPNSKRGLLRLDYRVGRWDRAFFDYVTQLEKQKPVVFCGDLNVAHKEIDIANPKSNRRNAGFTDEERSSFDRLMAHGFVDTFRHFCPDPGMYTWWSQRPGVRERNVGWRIDYFCTSDALKPHLKAARIHSDIFGSDHCPISLVLCL